MFVKIITEQDLKKFIEERTESEELTGLTHFVMDLDKNFIKTLFGVVTDFGEYYIRKDNELVEEISTVSNMFLEIINYRKEQEEEI